MCQFTSLLTEHFDSCSQRSLDVMKERNSLINHCHPEIKICLLFQEGLSKVPFCSQVMDIQPSQEEQSTEKASACSVDCSSNVDYDLCYAKVNKQRALLCNFCVISLWRQMKQVKSSGKRISSLSQVCNFSFSRSCVYFKGNFVLLEKFCPLFNKRKRIPPSFIISAYRLQFSILEMRLTRS